MANVRISHMQSSNKRFKSQTSEGVGVEIREITKLCCSVDVVQTPQRLSGIWIIPGTAGSGVPKYHLPFLAYTVHSGKHSYTSILQLRQILSFGFYNLFIRASSCLILNP